MAQALQDHGLRVLAHAPLPLNNPSPLVRQATLDRLALLHRHRRATEAPLCTTTLSAGPATWPKKRATSITNRRYQILIKHGRSAGRTGDAGEQPDNQHQLKYFRRIFFRLPDLKLTFDIGHGNVNTARNAARLLLCPGRPPGARAYERQRRHGRRSPAFRRAARHQPAHELQVLCDSI